MQFLLYNDDEKNYILRAGQVDLYKCSLDLIHCLEKHSKRSFSYIIFKIRTHNISIEST